ncbi:acetyl-CoA carboxylase biotin carboxylase subunit family protein [Nonomuraea sp. NPDC050394]|uniref:acetyl-CoA carboxylase biotin carboxylase subunit family protein n=1 Tax=Nonomuraea sp. NPDC050394 TaxID=3364363 RepID=UPI0037ADE4F8
MSDGFPPDDPADHRPLILLVNSGMNPQYREWGLRGLHREFRLWLLDAREATWDRPYLAGQTKVDALDLDEALDAAKELFKRMPFAGVLCYDEMRVHNAARIAEALGVPTSPSEAILACRDKSLTRARMTPDIPGSVRSTPVPDAAAAHRVAAEIGYPVVLKPRALAGSEGVARVDGPEQLDAQFAFTERAHFAEVERYAEGVLVEEYLDGPEIGVDAAVFHGEVEPVFISRKELDRPPTFEETGHFVSTDDPLLRDPEIVEVVRAAHAALGFDNGVTHTELRLTARGPRVVELNGRLSGDLVSYVGLLATGVDLLVAAARIACGERPDVRPRRRSSAAVRYFYPPHDMVVDDLRLDTDRLPPGIWEVTLLAEPGKRLLLPPGSFVKGRMAAGFAVGEDAAACDRSLKGLGELFHIRGRRIDG